MDVMSFIGSEGWRAVSIDPEGKNLPLEHGPWTPHRNVKITDAGEVTDLKANGFHLHRTENDDA